MKESVKMQSHSGIHGSRIILSGSRLLWPGDSQNRTVLGCERLDWKEDFYFNWMVSQHP